MKNGKSVLMCSIICFISLALSGCGTLPGKNTTARREIFAMDTYMEIECEGAACEKAADEAVAEIRRLDGLLSTGDPGSEISKLNRDGSGKVSPGTSELIEKALDVGRDTDGAFDITVYPLMELWGFTTGEYRVPGDEEIEKVLGNMGNDKVTVDPGKCEVTLTEGTAVDLGGIAKGYASDRIREIFEKNGISRGKVSLGGNVDLYGTKNDGQPWRVGIRDPYDPERSDGYLGILTLDEGRAVITSGTYERFFTSDDGTRYHHIMDPKTGRPASNGVVQVTVVGDSGELADALTTACFVMGKEKSAEYYGKHKGEFELIIADDEGKVFITKGLEGMFRTERELEIIG